MKLLTLALLICAVTGISACSASRANLADNERSWKSRGSDVLPHTEAEKLAVGVMQSEGKPLQRGSLKAYREGEDGSYSVVVVEEIPSSPEDFIEKIRYRMLGPQIMFVSSPQYLTQTDRKREANAREVAFQAKEGRLPILPEIYDDKYLYEPAYSGGCRVEVTEKDTERNPVATYTIDVCK
jgi:hypothetical protein